MPLPGTLHSDNVEKIVRTFDTLAGERSNWENQWQEIADCVLGRRDFEFGSRIDPGRKRTMRIYDSTARDANELLAAALHALLTNPATDWFQLRFFDARFNDSEESLVWLEDVREAMANAFRRSGSGFTTNMHEVYSDLTGFCTAGLYTEEEVGEGPVFSARPLAELFPFFDSFGRLAGIFRKFEEENWKAVETFGEDAKFANEQLEDNPLQTRTYLHHVRSRQSPLPGRLDADGMPWESIYIDLDAKQAISTGGYWEMPYMVPRWSVDAGERFGRGPGVNTLPDAQMLNAIWKTYIRNAEKTADPPLLVDNDGVIPGTEIQLTPSSKITVRRDGESGFPVQYLEHRGRFELTGDVIESRTRRIEKAFHSEIIQAFQDPRMTATQVIELARLSQRILSPVLGRMQVELLEPLIERTYGILSRMPGKFPVAPEFLQDATIRVEYVSPVARAQKASDAQAILDSFTAAQAMAQAVPDVLDNIDFDVAVREIFEGNGVNVKVMRPSADVIEIRQAKAELAQEREQFEQGVQSLESGAKATSAAADAAVAVEPAA